MYTVGLIQSNNGGTHRQNTVLFCFQGRFEWTTGTLQPYEKGVSKKNKPKKTTTI